MTGTREEAEEKDDEGSGVFRLRVEVQPALRVLTVTLPN